MRYTAVLTCLVMAAACVQATEPVRFTYTLPQAIATSAGVFDGQGRLVRTLWTMKATPVGEQSATWDGLDDLGHNVPPGAYQVRIALNGGQYRCLGTIGNSGVGNSMQSGTADLVVDRSSGAIWTANGWEEAGQDFKKIDADGKHVMDAKFRVRNGAGGSPNGMPQAIAVEKDFIFCSVYTLNDTFSDGTGSSAGGTIIRKFRADSGEPVKFTDTDKGYIRVHFPSREWASPWGHETMLSMVVAGETLYAADKEANLVRTYDKTTGKPGRTIEVKAPLCIVLDSAKRLWVLSDQSSLVVMDLEGKALGTPALGEGRYRTIRVVDDKQLWAANVDKSRIEVYTIDGVNKLTQVRTIGQKAQPGKFDPLGIYRLTAFDVMPDGGFVMAHSPHHGCVMSRFDKSGKLLWQQVGLEFCTNATYDPKEPDLIISTLMHAYRLTDSTKGEWRFEGNLLNSEQLRGRQASGNPRIIELGGKRFYYMLTGAGASIFRFDDGQLVPVAVYRLSFDPRQWDTKVFPEPADKTKKAACLSWIDANGDAKVQLEECTQPELPMKLGGNYSMDVDAKGNIFIPQQSGPVLRLPLAKLDARGNPVYELGALAQWLPADTSMRKLRPMKVVPTPDGGAYVLSAADAGFHSTDGHSARWGLAWMGGWTVQKYTAAGERLFSVVLPDHCTGLDFVPDTQRTKDLGFVAGCFHGKKLYHYTSDGLLVDVLEPNFQTGWLDHNGSVNLNRNPKDKMVDLFAEESFRNRISWYRFDDSGIRTMTVAVKKPAVDGQTYATEADVYKAIAAGAAAKAPAQAAQELRKAMAMAGPQEQHRVRQLLAAALMRDKDMRAEGFALLEQAVQQNDSPAIVQHEMLVELAGQYRRDGQVDKALALYDRSLQVKVAWNVLCRSYEEGAAACLQVKRYDEALTRVKAYQKYLSTQDYAESGHVMRAAQLAATALVAQGKVDDAIAEYRTAMKFRKMNDDALGDLELRIAKLLSDKGDKTAASKIYQTIASHYKHARPDFIAQAHLESGDFYAAQGDTAKARAFYEKAQGLAGAKESLKTQATRKLSSLQVSTRPAQEDGAEQRGRTSQ